MLQEIVLRQSSGYRLDLLIELIPTWFRKVFTKKKENFFLIH